MVAAARRGYERIPPDGGSRDRKTPNGSVTNLAEGSTYASSLRSRLFFALHRVIGSLAPFAAASSRRFRNSGAPSAKYEIPLKLVFPAVYELFCGLRNRLSPAVRPLANPDAPLAVAGFLRKLGRDLARQYTYRPCHEVTKQLHRVIRFSVDSMQSYSCRCSYIRLATSRLRFARCKK